jgi:hypothetical protein
VLRINLQQQIKIHQINLILINRPKQKIKIVVTPNYIILGILVRKLRIIYFQLSDKSPLGQVTKSYERTLIIAGHIFAEKRRKLSVRTFSDLKTVDRCKIKLETFEQK